MQATDVIRAAMEMSKGFTTGLLADMADAPLKRFNPETGNHAYWTLGHLVFAEASLLDEYLLGRPNRHAAWAPKFGIGSKPTDNMDSGPSYSELMEEFETIRAAFSEHFEQMNDEDLAKPCHQLSGPGPQFETNLDCLVAISVHMMFHAGQVAEARRADGREPVMM